MKISTKYLALVLITALSVVGTISCTKHDQEINLNPATSAITTPVAIITQNDTLTSFKINSTLVNGNLSGTTDVGGGLGFIWNGGLDPQWAKAQSITTVNTVPDLGNNTFEGFIGNTTTVTVRSLYSDSCIYFLFEWAAAFQSIYSSPWYFNPAPIKISGHTLMEWHQMGNAPIWDYHGNMVTPSFPQDEFVIMFNVANSCAEFNSSGCYGTCHTYPPVVTLDTINDQITTTYGAGGGMFTNSSNQKCDIWRVRTVQTLNTNQANDCFLWWNNGNISNNAVTSDTDVTAAGLSNKQTLTVLHTTIKEVVPLWVNINGTSAGMSTPTNIMVTDTATPGYYYVVSVDTNGVLYCANSKATRSVITYTLIPGASYETIGTGSGMTLGVNCIPGTIVSPYTGDEADVRANLYWTGTGYKLLLKRELKTADKYLEDIDFTPFSNNPGTCTPFGYGVMFNGADNEHAIANGLQLRFSAQAAGSLQLKNPTPASIQQIIKASNNASAHIK